MTIYSGSSCGLCGAVVRRELITLHSEWHETAEGGGTHDVVGKASGDPSLDRMLRVVAALNSLPEVSARAKFVTDLRARLLAAPPLQRAAPSSEPTHGSSVPSEVPVTAGDH